MRATFANTLTAGTMREGNQIDVRPNPERVSSVVAMSGECEAGDACDREERELQEGGVAASAREGCEGCEGGSCRCSCRCGSCGSCGSSGSSGSCGGGDEPERGEDLRGAGRDGHRSRSDGGGVRAKETVRHEAAKTVEDVMKYVDARRGLPTKNLFLKAKKANGPEDSGLWMVVAAYDTTVDMKKLTSVGHGRGVECRI